MDAGTIVRQIAGEEHWAFENEFPDYEQLIANPHLTGRAQGDGPVVCVIDFDRNQEAAVRAVTALQALSHSRCTSIALSEQAQPELILAAMRAGCSEYLAKPLSVNQLRDSIARQRIRWLASEDRRSKRSGQVLAFLGVRGGAGATTLAVHLATFLAKLHGKRVLIVDQHRHLGHVALCLGLDAPTYTFYEAVRNVSRLDNELLSSFVAHHSSGIDVLSSPANWDDSDEVDPELTERAMKFLAGVYEFVIVDCAGGLDDESLSTVSCSDGVYLIATQEVPALRDLSCHMERVLGCGLAPGKLKVVINRYSSDRGVTIDQIESAIQRSVSVRVPNHSAELSRSVDMGNPIGPERKSEFVSQMKKWSASLVPVQATPPETKRRFAFWS